MKRKVLLGFSLLIGVLQAFSQTNYADYSQNDKTRIFYEDFSTNDYGWVTGTFENCRIYSYTPGYYELKSICEGQFTKTNFNINNGFTIDQSKDFEIETSYMFVSGEDNNSNTLNWGQGQNQDDRFRFGFSGNGQYIIDKRQNGQWINFKSWTESSFLKQNAYNKLTIRKIGFVYYFFINEGFVYSCPFESFFGQQLSIQVNQNSTIWVNLIRISYLQKKEYVESDYTAPEISIYEPAVGRGLKIVEANKQVLVKGKATDKSGIYEVTINGIDASVNTYGEFEQTVKLAVGDNTITVKATDTKNNTANYTFYINRQQEVVSNDIVVNDNPSTGEEKRIALIIGNSNYGGGQYLKNPVNDANLMATTLQSLGFLVIKRIDATKQIMEQAVKEFSKKLPNYNVALFYYAGHGLQVDGLNYLIPVDAKLNEKADCKFEAMPVNFVVEEFENYPNNVNVVILDACRNNPFRSWARGGERGFKAIAPTSGTIISFATSEGSTASDGEGKNGLFTQELVKQMVVPQAIESVFKKTRVQVQKLSNGAQSPQEWSQLTGDFFFKK